MFISAYWHGIHAGYHLSMLTTVPAMVSEFLLEAAFQNNRSPAQQTAFNWFSWFVRCRTFDYMSMGFMLLTWQETMRYWGSIYYVGHVWTIVLIVIGYCCKPKRSKKKVEDSGDGERRSDGDKKVQ